MPPKKKFSKDQIIDAAFEIARVEGIDSITIRKVAEKLGSSIAPIYVNFNDVDELLKAVIAKIADISKQILLEQNSGSPFQDIGLASLRFAKEYSVLFRDFVLKNNHHVQNYDQDMGHMLIEEMKKDPELEGFTDEELMTILLKMRVFQLGLTIMVANELLPEEFSEEKMKQLLNSMATDVVVTARLRKEGKLDVENNFGI